MFDAALSEVHDMAPSAPFLYRLFYRSRQTPEVAADLDFVVGQIIRTSIRQNRTVGLTGLLLVAQGHFIQALEGSDDAVHAAVAYVGGMTDRFAVREHERLTGRKAF